MSSRPARVHCPLSTVSDAPCPSPRASLTSSFGARADLHPAVLISYCPGACQRASQREGHGELDGEGVRGARPCERSRLGVRFDVALSSSRGGGWGVRILAAGWVFSVHQGPSDSTAAPAPVWTVVVQWLVGTLCVDSTDPAFARRTSQVRSRSKPERGGGEGRNTATLNSRQNTREVENTDKHRGAGACQGQESAVEQVLLD